MESDQRTQREITYKVGWKRGKIVSAPKEAEARAAAEHSGPGHTVSESVCRSLHRFNDTALWKETPIPSVKLMKAGMFLLPAIVFALFVWMVYWLSRFS